MFERTRVLNGDVRIPAGAAFAGLHPAKRLALLIGLLAQELELRPQVCHLAGSRTVRVVFSHALFEGEGLAREYGALVGSLLGTVQISMHGMLEGLEEGAVLPRPAGDTVVYEKYNATGKDFSTLRDIYLEMRFNDPGFAGFAAQLLPGAPWEGYIAVGSQWDGAPFTAGLFEPEKLFFYRYIALEEGEARYAGMLDALDIGQIVVLWERFFTYGVTCEEFERLYELLENGAVVDIIKWEIALELALEGLGIAVQARGDGFEVTDSGGQRMVFGYNRPAAAEKLFVKFIFPRVASRDGLNRHTAG